MSADAGWLLAGGEGGLVAGSSGSLVAGGGTLVKWQLKKSQKIIFRLKPSEDDRPTLESSPNMALYVFGSCQHDEHSSSVAVQI